MMPTVASAAAELRWTGSRGIPPQTIHAQFELPHRCLSLTRDQLPVAITLGN